MVEPGDQQDLIGPPDEAELDRILDSNVDDVPEDRWARTLARLVEVLFARYRRNGMAPEDAGKLANATVIEIAHYFGGRPVYLPRGDRLKIALRDAEIFRRARRGNIEALADEFGLNVIQIYRIIRQQKALHIAKVQGRLFEEEKP